MDSYHETGSYQVAISYPKTISEFFFFLFLA